MKPSAETSEALYTYQELQARFGVHYSTVWRWFAKRPKFKPTSGTVRVTQTELNKFILESTTNAKTSRNRPNR